MAGKRQWNIFFEKSWRKVWWATKMSVPLHSQFRNEVANKIGVWCNGNTTDSGPVILGSSPSIPTKQSLFITNRLFSYSPLFHILWINPTLHPQKTNTGISDSADAACEQLYPRMSEIPVFCYYIMIALFKDILYTLL